MCPWLGIAKVLFNKETEELLGVHIIGLHAADLIQECANAMAAKTTVRELSYMVGDERAFFLYCLALSGGLLDFLS